MKTWYVLVCRQCGDPDKPLPVPFESAEARGEWATEHTKVSGHDQWLVIDQIDPESRAP